MILYLYMIVEKYDVRYVNSVHSQTRSLVFGWMLRQ